MKIVVAMDSFKGCLTAHEACQAVAQDLKCHIPITIPVSDGGDGFIDAIAQQPNYFIETITVSGPLNGTPVNAKIAFSHDHSTAIIEAAQACGLIHLSPAQRNPMLTDSRGVGELIIHAIKHGCKKIVIGLGGSATNDLGMGMLYACGVKFLDKNGIILNPKGENIGKIYSLRHQDKFKNLFNGIELIIASDVTNPLCGINGCAQVYSPQKGATPQMVEELERGAQQCQQIFTQYTGHNYHTTPGAGAAGGMGFALMTFANCLFRSGATLFLDLINFDKIISDADLIITGEGKSDHQTLMGKIPHAVMTRATQKGVQTALISGQVVNKNELLNAGFSMVVSSLPKELSLELAIQKNTATTNLSIAASKLVSLLKPHSC